MIVKSFLVLGAVAVAIVAGESETPDFEIVDSPEDDASIPVEITETPWMKPIPAGPEAMTVKKVSEKFLPFYREMIVAPFENSPDAQQEWADEARALLEGEAQLMADFDSAGTGCVVRQEAERFVKLGATYPVFKYMWGRTLFLRGKDSAARPFLNEVFEQAKTDETLPSVLRMHLMTGKGAQEKTALSAEDRQAVCETLIEAFTDPAYADLDWTYVADLYLERIELKHLVELMPLLEKAQRTGGVDVRVISLCHNAKVAVQQAWSARGTGFANTVRPEGWEKFGSGIEYARDCYERAWQIRQDLPTLANGGARTAMGNKREGRKWFDRVVSAQLDFREAYKTYIYYGLYPRWGGSIEEMKAFGEECLATGRFDTEVPLFYVESMFRISHELGGNWADAFKDPEVFDTCTNVLMRYMPPDDAPATPATILKRYECASGLSALAYLSGDYQAIRRLNKHLRMPSGSGQESTAYRYFPSTVSCWEVMNKIFAFSKADGVLLGELDLLMKQALYTDAEKLLEEIYTRKKIGADGINVACTYDLQLAIERSRKTGDWFDMIPAQSRKHGSGPYISYNNTISCTNQVFWCGRKEGYNTYAVPIPHSIEYTFTVQPLNTTEPASFGLGLDTYFGCGDTRPVLFFEREQEDGKWKLAWLSRTGQPFYRIRKPLTLGESVYTDTSPPTGSEDKFVELDDAGTFTVVIRAVRSGQGYRSSTIVDVEVNGSKCYEGLDFERAFFDRYPKGRLPTVFLQNVRFYNFKGRVLQNDEEEAQDLEV